MPKISVIICTYNPRLDYLEKVLQTLKQQTLSLDLWELLLIDNASDSVLATVIDLSWHPDARHIRENQLGLTPARLRGIKEAKAEVLVFVDDDNLLELNYLETTWQISKDYPFIGVWGGQVIPQFEETPPEWTKPYWIALAIKEFDQDQWSNLVNQYETTPCGAGMCIRKFVAEKYSELVKQDSQRQSMGRKGQKLTSYEDSDMAFTACDLGYGTGRFAKLKLMHLMPATRLTEEYLLRLIESSTYSGIIVESYRGKLPQLKKSWQSKLADWYRFCRMSPRERRFYKAQQRGIKIALQEL
ncbi:glycosyltransferase [Calothrix sp. PCC 7507]|uniref:glycosyltransferase n=1 Tax=Calothrix sp. PCC 7507 TaxID=99598 RepID=UPI00029F3795|nr:glycosyltransferase [Calothrix sp. PCC 7507]AFY30873.1 glycosyl transferase family 2 [Calothrix sp. PCC 7507]